MKNFTQKFIGLLALVFAMSFTANSQEIGDIFEGGIVFHKNEDGTGLVASMEDLGWVSADQDDVVWGCLHFNVDGADGEAIGTGYQNTMDIINFGCVGNTPEWPSAAQLAIDYESDGYNDWYMPSIDELLEMYNTIGCGNIDWASFGGAAGNYWDCDDSNSNIGGFKLGAQYWSSTEGTWNQALAVNMRFGSNQGIGKSSQQSLRVIRSVHFETGCTDASALNYSEYATEDDGSCIDVVSGCMDSTMSNYNSEANTEDGSCVSWEELADDLQGQLDEVVPEDGIGQSDVDAAYADGVASVEIPDCEEVVTQNIPLNLPVGWSMFGYTCLESLDVVEAFSDISDMIELVKDEWGLAYLPSYGFNAFDNLEFGEGYQIKMIEEVTDFQFCTTITGTTLVQISDSYDEGSEVDYNLFMGIWNVTSYYSDGGEMIGDSYSMTFHFEENGQLFFSDSDNTSPSIWGDCTIGSFSDNHFGLQGMLYIEGTPEDDLITDINSIDNPHIPINAVAIESVHFMFMSNGDLVLQTFGGDATSLYLEKQ